jgi:radical SAM enzyme (TIGR01210 family)
MNASMVRVPNATRLLSTIAIDARSTRKDMEVPDSYFTQVTATYAEIWFPSAGCPFDALGHCTMCNYGKGPEVSPEQMYTAVERAVEGLAPSTEIVWVSAFNTLFEKEVPAEARRRIFEALAKTGVKQVLTETHPASVRMAVISEVVKILGDCAFSVQLGVETMDEFVRYVCVNKPFNNAVLSRAVDTIHRAGGTVYANLLAGIPFLSEQEVVDDMAWSIEASIDLGCDSIVLFPNYVKENTVAALLAAAGRYEPPDLWTMRDIIAAIPREHWDRVYFGWLQVKEHPGAPRVLCQGDPGPSERLLELLRAFNDDRDPGALAEALTIPAPREIAVSGDPPLPERILDGYRWLADTYLPSWWDGHGDATTAEVTEAFECSSGGIMRGTARCV